MLDCLAGEEQAPGDLGAGEPFTEQGQHFVLSLGEPPEVLRPGPCRLHAEVPQQGSSGVRVAASS